MMQKWQLPEGWEFRRLGDPDFCTIIMGQSPPSTTYNTDGHGLPFFQGKADFGETYPTVRKWCTDPKRISEVGDVLISVRAPVGPTNLTPFQCAIGRGLAALRPTSRLDTKYLLYVLRSIESEIEKKGSGSTFKNISKTTLSSIEIPIPYPDDPDRSLAEQRRIVARIEALLAEVRAARALLKSMENDLNMLENSTLFSAFRGEL